MIRKIQFFAPPALLVSFVLPGTSLAADGKTYSAAECVGNSSSVMYSVGRVYNNSSNTAQSVWCPAINDAIAGSIQSAWVRVYDSNAADNFTCRLRSYAFNGPGPGYSGSWSTRTSVDEGWQQLNFNGLNSAGEDYTYHVQCDIPAKEDGDLSYVLLYHVTETA